MIIVHRMYEMSAASDSTKLVRMFRSNLIKFVDYCLNNEVTFSPIVTTRVLSELPALLPNYTRDRDFWSNLHDVFIKCATAKPTTSMIKTIKGEIENSNLDEESKIQLRHLLDIAIGWKRSMPQISSSPSKDTSTEVVPQIESKPVEVNWWFLCDKFNIIDENNGRIFYRLENFMHRDLGYRLSGESQYVEDHRSYWNDLYPNDWYIPLSRYERETVRVHPTSKKFKFGKDLSWKFAWDEFRITANELKSLIPEEFKDREGNLVRRDDMIIVVGDIVGMPYEEN